ncbi:MAG: hypothetical protein WD802_03850, partial [Gemmatimonadaceae bacterium]
LGRAPGTNNNLLTATKTGLTGSPVTFTATAKFGMRLVATGSDHSCGLNAANDVYCWGWNQYGQLGDGTNTDRSAPVKLGNVSLRPPSLALGKYYSCLLLSTGKAHCWGYNGSGSLGDGTNTDSSTPVPVGGTVTFTRIAAAILTTCGLNPFGGVWCWGDNDEGEFGNGTTTSSNVPVLSAGGFTFGSIYRGGLHTCALTTEGKASCWGYNANGQLGDGTTTQRLTPTLVSGGLTFTSLTLGERHSCGLLASGKAYCWGWNNVGQLGNGSTANALSPQPVSGNIAFIQLAAEGGHTCGITSSGVAYCWGFNFNGQLGIGTTGPSVTAPSPVTGGRSFSAIAAGASNNTCGVPVGGGHPLCWGSNGLGQLGNGTTVTAPLPVEVLTPPIP